MSLVKQIQAEYHSKCFRLFVSHFESLLQQARDKLDVAEGNQIFKLQGEIKVLKQLLQVQQAREIKYTDKDGGFGVQ